MGPWGIAFGLYQWFANPLLGLAILARRRFRRVALGAGVIALGLALSCLGIERLPDNRSYDFLPLTGFGAGYYLWPWRFCCSAWGRLGGAARRVRRKACRLGAGSMGC
jgi:hypothetical protein